MHFARTYSTDESSIHCGEASVCVGDEQQQATSTIGRSWFLTHSPNFEFRWCYSSPNWFAHSAWRATFATQNCYCIIRGGLCKVHVKFFADEGLSRALCGTHHIRRHDSEPRQLTQLTASACPSVYNMLRTGRWRWYQWWNIVQRLVAAIRLPIRGTRRTAHVSTWKHLDSTLNYLLGPRGSEVAWAKMATIFW